MLNQIAGKLENSFFHAYGNRPGPSEVNSWRNSLRAVADVFEYGRLDDHGVILEYQLPMTSRRLDCLVCGRDSNSRDSAVIIELKQWDRCIETAGENEVVTFVGGREREVLHPVFRLEVQGLPEDTHTAFYEEPSPTVLNACAYLHNYSLHPGDHLLAPKFQETLALYPLFSMDEVAGLSDYLGTRMSGGHGLEVLRRVEESKYRPAKKLMDHVASVIRNKSEYVLLDEQLVVFDKVLACAKSGFHNKSKAIIVVRGGPGTGKSVIAINLMASLLAQGYNAQYATGSRAFTQTLWKAIGSRGAVQFKYFNSYRDAQENEIDVLICDEAHRIRETSNNRFTPRSTASAVPQIEELIRTGKTTVFFIDDHQVVRPGEIGSSDYIQTFAHRAGCSVFEYELEAQFRCAGSDAFVNWITNTLGIRRTANAIWDGAEGFDFRIVDSPQALDAAIRERLAEGHTARLTAGFCWKWSEPDTSGNLVDDVVIEDWRRPWNAKPEAARLASGIPKATLWAYDPRGVGQVGCIYTAQGFEFDYVGVIVGRDLSYDFDSGSWVGNPVHCADSVVRRAGNRFLDYVKNSYRVLFSRGMKGCYVYFQDEDTAKFFRTRIDVRS